MEEFLKSTFKGKRFDEHTLPMGLMRDLLAYESLIIDLAKHLYRVQHPNRQRLPKGFAASFRLHLKDIEPGSAMPVMVTHVEPAPLLPYLAPEFGQARDMVAACIAGNPPQDFPEKYYAYFNEIGRSLAVGEEWDLGHGAHLTPQRRKELALRGSRVYEKDGEVTGIIEEFDLKKQTVRLRCEDGSETTMAVNNKILEFIRKYTLSGSESSGSQRHKLAVKFTGTYNSADALQKVKEVNEVEPLPNYELAARFDEITTLEEGWHDGDGRSLATEAMQGIAEKITATYPDSLPLPYIYPTQDGTLLLEWEVSDSPSLEFDADLSQARYCDLSMEDDAERLFELSNEEGWKALFEFLEKTLS